MTFGNLLAVFLFVLSTGGILIAELRRRRQTVFASGGVRRRQVILAAVALVPGLMLIWFSGHQIAVNILCVALPLPMPPTSFEPGICFDICGGLPRIIDIRLVFALYGILLTIGGLAMAMDSVVFETFPMARFVGGLLFVVAGVDTFAPIPIIRAMPLVPAAIMVAAVVWRWRVGAYHKARTRQRDHILDSDRPPTVQAARDKLLDAIQSSGNAWDEKCDALLIDFTTVMCEECYGLVPDRMLAELDSVVARKFALNMMKMASRMMQVAWERRSPGDCSKLADVPSGSETSESESEA